MVQIKSIGSTMRFASVSSRHLFHGTLENTHRVQPHQNSPTGREVISGFLEVLYACARMCAYLLLAVLFISRVLRIFHKQHLSVRGVHYAQMNMKPFFFSEL